MLDCGYHERVLGGGAKPRLDVVPQATRSRPAACRGRACLANGPEITVSGGGLGDNNLLHLPHHRDTRPSRGWPTGRTRFAACAASWRDGASIS